MDVFVEVKDTVLLESEMVKDGKTIVFQKQMALLHTGGNYPLPFKVSVNRNAYPVGKYRLSDQSFRVGKFGGLEIDPYGLSLVALAK